MAEEEKEEVFRRYSKDDNPRLEVRQLSSKPIRTVTAAPRERRGVAYDYSHNGRSYYKRDGERDYFLVVLIMEDAKRTHQYFIPICKKSGSRFKICPVCNKDHGIPAPRMLDTAAEQVEELGLDFASGDHLYMLCDLDHYRKALCELNARKKREWNLIISNPCIELWFYYHHRDCKPDFGPCEQEDKYPELMKSICGTLLPGGIDHRKLFTTFDGLEIPITNARKNYALEPGSDFMPALGSTQMFIVMEKIKELFSENK